ncbi:MAG: outer membrane protein assembly factor BamC, partial [Methylococcales bacterium]|nr:outer membrane protein assembly factor BamC [Methylococcales bacterium]
KEINSEDKTTKEINSEDKTTRVDFVMFDGGATRLRINENFSPVWRLVAKTLSRNRIEITSRNKADGQLVVQYDPDKTNFEDDSIKDEFLFIFGSDYSQEKEYRIRLIKHNNNIEIIVLNDENQPLSDGAGLKLLKLLFSTLHKELVTLK